MYGLFWELDINNLREKFINNEPFSHIVINNFLNEDYIEKIYHEFPNNYNDWYKYENSLEVKYACDNINSLNDNLKIFLYIII